MFINRLKSFIWRLGAALVTFGVAWLSENIGLLELPLWTQGVIALGLGELTKWWNSYMTSLGRRFFGGKK